MKLSYSKYKYYMDCPKRYYNEANHVEYPEKDSRYFALYGFLIEMFFKNYCNVYSKRSVPLTETEITVVLRRMWDKVLEEHYVNWTEPWVKQSSEDIFFEVREDINKNLEAFDFWRNAKSEVSFDIHLKKAGDELSCRMDFIVNNIDNTVEILDGKGTLKMDRVDREQLYFYILMYYLHFKKLPDKAGFLFYRFQHIEYIDFDMDSINRFKRKLSLVKRTIKKSDEFPAIVKISKHCKWCPYRHDCKELFDTRKLKASKRKKKVVIDIDFEGEVKSFSPRGLPS